MIPLLRLFTLQLPSLILSAPFYVLVCLYSLESLQDILQKLLNSLLRVFPITSLTIFPLFLQLIPEKPGFLDLLVHSVHIAEIFFRINKAELEITRELDDYRIKLCYIVLLHLAKIFLDLLVLDIILPVLHARVTGEIFLHTFPFASSTFFLPLDATDFRDQPLTQLLSLQDQSVELMLFIMKRSLSSSAGESLGFRVGGAAAIPIVEEGSKRTHMLFECLL